MFASAAREGLPEAPEDAADGVPPFEAGCSVRAAKHAASCTEAMWMSLGSASRATAVRE